MGVAGGSRSAICALLLLILSISSPSSYFNFNFGVMRVGAQEEDGSFREGEGGGVGVATVKRGGGASSSDSEEGEEVLTSQGRATLKVKRTDKPVDTEEQAKAYHDKVVDDENYDTYIEVSNHLVHKQILLYWINPEDKTEVYLNTLETEERVRHLCNMNDEFLAKTKNRAGVIKKWGFMFVNKKGIIWQILPKNGERNYHGQLHVYNEQEETVYVYWYSGRPYESKTGAMHLIDSLKGGEELHEVIHWGQTVEFNFENGTHAHQPVWFNYHNHEIEITGHVGPVTDQYIRTKYYKDVRIMDPVTGEFRVEQVKKSLEEVRKFSIHLDPMHPQNLGEGSVHLDKYRDEDGTLHHGKKVSGGVGHDGVGSTVLEHIEL